MQVYFGKKAEVAGDTIQSNLPMRSDLLSEIAPEVTGHGLPLSKCEAYKRVYDQPYGSS
jgi:hypothetical protein